MSTRNNNKLIVLLAVWALSAAYAATWIGNGWIPHDDGLLAQSAERVLIGEVPHLDFDEQYTGGLSYLNSVAFRIWGVNLRSLRIPLFVFFLAWIPAVYYVAAQFVRPVAAGAITLVAAAWSVPNYAASMPSWYNLFFAVFGTAALLRYLEVKQRRWLFVAGVFAGLSCLVKIVGLYFVAAVLLFAAFLEQSASRSQEAPTEANRSTGRPTAYTVFAFGSLLLFLTLLIALVFDWMGGREFVHFVLPAGALVAFYVWNERGGRVRPTRQRFGTLVGLVAPFALGLSLPLAVFLLPYAVSGSLGALYQGMFVKTTTQVAVTHHRLPSLLATTVGAIPLVIFMASSHSRLRVGWVKGTMIALALGSVLVAAGLDGYVYRHVWYSVRMLVPIVTLAGVATLMRPNPRVPISPLRRKQLLLLLCVTTMVSIVQFPVAAPIYFCFVAPLLVLTAAAVISSLGGSHFAPAAVLCFYLLFAILWLNQANIYSMGFQYRPSDATATLNLDRGGLRVTGEERDEYERLVAVLQARASGGFMYATPDSPEVYFLSGLRNPTPTFFDFLDDPEGRTTRILAALDEKRVQVVALNRRPGFSGDVPPDLAAELSVRFPLTMEVGRFEVRWREAGSAREDRRP